jgi:hypothetical protein
MAERAQWAKIGNGKVNGELGRRVALDPDKYGLQPQPSFIMRRGGLFEPDGRTKIPGAILQDMPPVAVAVIATPSDSKVEMPPMKHFLIQGVSVITAAKGALSENYAEVQALSQGGRLLGDSATVGGGIGLVDPLGRYIRRPDVNEVHVTSNGTLAAVASSDKPLPQAIQDAIDAGLAEPGNTSPIAVVRAELDDVSRKTAIIVNKLFSSNEPIDWRSLKMIFSNDQIEQALEERRRLMLSMYPLGSEGYSVVHGADAINGFDVWRNDWRFIGGFAELGRNEVSAALERTTGPDVGFAVGLGQDNRDGIYSLTGPGAGPGPTSSMMLADWEDMRRNMFPENVSAKTKKRAIRTTSISLESIETGRGFDERVLDESSFYAVNNYRTGWEPIFSLTATRGTLLNSSIISEVFAKVDELEKAGQKIRITPHSVTVDKEKLTIRHADDSFEGATVWVVRDQELHERYDGAKQVDIWWGNHIRRDQLPQLVYDGVESSLAEALSQHASLYLHELETAYEAEERQPKRRDFSTSQDYFDWRENNPKPTREVKDRWDKHLDIQKTNNLFELFTDGDIVGDSDLENLSRKYLAKLERKDSQFFTAARRASQQWDNLLRYQTFLGKRGQDLSPEEMVESQVRRWISEIYATEAQTRFRELGATEKELRRLRN